MLETDGCPISLQLALKIGLDNFIVNFKSVIII